MILLISSCLGVIIGGIPLILQSILVWKIKHVNTQVVSYMTGTHIMCMLMLSGSVISDSLWPRGLYPTRLLCPWNFPGKNIGVGYHFLLQGIFPTQEMNLISFVSYICGHILYHQCHLGSPDICCRSQVINVSTKLKCDSTWRWQWGKKDEQSGHKLKCIEASLGEQKKLHSNSMHVFEGSSKGFTGESGISEEPQWMKDGSEFLHSPKASRQFFPGLCWFSLLLFPPPSPHFCSASTPSRMSFHLLCTWMLLIPYDPDWALQFRASHSCTDSCILKCL